MLSREVNRHHPTTHNMEEAAKLFDQVAFLNNGLIVSKAFKYSSMPSFVKLVRGLSIKNSLGESKNIRNRLILHFWSTVNRLILVFQTSDKEKFAIQSSNEPLKAEVF